MRSFENILNECVVRRGDMVFEKNVIDVVSDVISMLRIDFE